MPEPGASSSMLFPSPCEYLGDTVSALEESFQITVLAARELGRLRTWRLHLLVSGRGCLPVSTSISASHPINRVSPDFSLSTRPQPALRWLLAQAAGPPGPTWCFVPAGSGEAVHTAVTRHIPVTHTLRWLPVLDMKPSGRIL